MVPIEVMQSPDPESEDPPSEIPVNHLDSSISIVIVI